MFAFYTRNGLARGCVLGCIMWCVLCAAMWVGSPLWAAAAALAAAGAALAAPQRRMAAIEALSVLGFMAAMFGPEGAGGFAAMLALTGTPAAAATRGARPVVALTLAAGLALAMVCVGAVLSGVLPSRWAPWAILAPALALSGPATVLRGWVAAAWGPARADAWRLSMLGPLLVAVVVGAGTMGLQGAAIGWAAMQLATPLAALMLVGRYTGLAIFALGVLAAGFVATLAIGAALAFAHGSALAAAPALVVGLSVYALGLRVYAPRRGRIRQRAAAQVAAGQVAVGQAVARASAGAAG